jgi:DNA helicase-2/ATP-dependent DNA helicase PcrA
MAWYDTLSPEQRAAAAHYGVNVRLLAGPGTGKTRVLAAHAAYLIEEHGAQPDDILLLTFTRKAAANMRGGLLEVIGEGAELPDVRTLHSFSLRALLDGGAHPVLPTPIRVADDYEERAIVRPDLKAALQLASVTQASKLLDRMSADWETLNADLTDLGQRQADPQFVAAWRDHRELYAYTLRAELVYQLKHALDLDETHLKHPPRHVIVDEYQDLNPCDLAVVKRLVDGGAQLYCAGDDDQSIYGFRYAQPYAIRHIEEYHGRPFEMAELHECWRCAPRVLTFGTFVVSQEVGRLDKHLLPKRQEPVGEVAILRFDDQFGEAAGVARLCRWLWDHEGLQPADMLVLLRSDYRHGFSDPLAEALAAAQIPASVAADPMALLNDGSPRLLLAVLRLIVNPDDHLAWRTALDLTDGIGEATVRRLAGLARDGGLGFCTAIRAVHDDPTLIGLGDRVRDACARVDALTAHAHAGEPADAYPLIERLAGAIIADRETRQEVLRLVREVTDEIGAVDLETVLTGMALGLGENEQEHAADEVAIMTMHQAKGLTAEAVVVVAAEDEYLPGDAVGSAVDDERRLLYVSLTRARHRLYITHCGRRLGRQAHTGSTPGRTRRTFSRFLRDADVVSQPGALYLSRIGA